MLSILIPIYNYDVTNLVIELYKQVNNLNINYEIILIDDFSQILKEKNRELVKIASLKYIELSENYGRSKIRNYLADLAKYDNLIFLDCDSGINKDNFISNYLNFKDKNIVYGGTIYKNCTKEYSLHFKYGSLIEAQSVSKRTKSPNKSFKTNNFMIKKSIFKKVRFNENIKGYGHEDTIFGFELEKNNIEIYHIENSVIHLGLEENIKFLEKTKTSIDNLIKLINLFPNEKKLFSNIKLLKYFFILKKLYLCNLIEIIGKIFEVLIIKNIVSSTPNLILFNFYKLYFLCSKK